MNEIKKSNSVQFFIDINSIRDILVFPSESGIFLKVRKGEILEQVKTNIISYYMTDEIFVRKRIAMVII